MGERVDGVEEACVVGGAAVLGGDHVGDGAEAVAAEERRPSRTGAPPQSPACEAKNNNFPVLKSMSSNNPRHEITIEEAATILAPPPPRTISSTIGSLRGRGRRLLAAASALALLLLLLLSRSPRRRPHGYGVVIDAGSTGSRVHVIAYRSSPAASAAAAALPWIDWAGTVSMKAAPGLLSFASDPGSVGRSLALLVEFAHGRRR
uniref:Uncharacterized protein n=1 Tax=Oryza meridionalis TaxID=40149 RepID=A0A0E0D3T7_9ORYZ